MMRKSNFWQRITAIIATVVITLGTLVGCNEPTTPTPPATTVTVNPKTLEMTVGELQALSATVSDNSAVTWTSENTAIVTVTNSGEVTAVKAGVTYVVATSGTASDKCKVTVTEPAPETPSGVTKFNAGIGVTTAFVGDEINVRASLKVDGKAQAITATYASSDETVAKVENDKLITYKTGTVTITANCTYDGENYTDAVTITVAEAPEDSYMLTTAKGEGIDKDVSLFNDSLLGDQIKIRHYTASSVEVYTLSFVEGKNFEIKNGSQSVGTATLSLVTEDAANALDEYGIVNTTLENDVTVRAKLTATVKLGNKSYGKVDVNAFIKADNVYTDFVEFNENTSVTNYFSYDFGAAGGGMEITEAVKYNGAPTLKLTVPTNLSYFRLSEIIANYASYGLKVGSRISFQVRFDGEPKTAGTHYYAIGKITSKNGASEFSNTNVCSYADAQTYITSGATEWKDVSFTLDEASFPLVDLGIQIAGNSSSVERYVYIACITIDNPGEVDYSASFATTVEWTNTGKNANVSWWGYSHGGGGAPNVTSGAVVTKLPEVLANSYQTAFGTASQSSALLCQPNVQAIDMNNNRHLQNISCELSNGMKGSIRLGLNKIRVRVYMEATGTLPQNASVTALTFMRQDGNGYGFAENLLQTVQPNTWTELVFNVPAEYLEANYLTVAFALKTYANSGAYSNEDVTLRFYIDSISFTN